MHYHALALKHVAEAILCKVGEVEVVVDAYAAINKFKLNILIDLFHLHKSGVWRAVGRYEAIAAEVLIVGVHRSAKVATICPVVLAIRAHGIDALVYPVPDEATLHVGVTLHDVEELAEVTSRVTHGVGKLAHDIWLASIGALCPCAEVVDFWVHGAADIGMRATIALLKLHEARLIALMYPLIHLAIYLAIATLVAHRPQYHRGVVLVALHHRLHTIVVRRLPLLAMRGMEIGVTAMIARTTAMCLDICLIHKQYAMNVAEVIPLRRLGIVACAHGIDIVLLHKVYILEHQLAIGDMTRSGVMLMDIHTVYH